ncbi:MAG: hydroxymethylbilane synthase [Acidobacteria bacterium]|nr:hydroxymethylbilane synthase [Acidobacteriota bacterium]
MTTLRVGTRGSQLALFQANAVADLLRNQADVACEIVVIKTSGDRLAEAPLSQIGGKRLFVKEIEDALLTGSIDLAVHSSKDMSAELPSGLAIGAVLPREDARDAVVLPAGPRPQASGLRGLSLQDVARALGETPRIGTSSVRRTAQLARLFPGARFGAIRGNLDTRLRTLDEGGFDALVLAAAGLNRLARGHRISAVLPSDACVPAPGQGIIAVEIRSDDAAVRRPLEGIGDRTAAAALTAERTVVTHLGGGCQMPLGAYAAPSGDELRLTAIVVSLDGTRAARAEATGPVSDPEGVGRRAAERLIANGAADILAEVERVRAAVEGLQP